MLIFKILEFDFDKCSLNFFEFLKCVSINVWRFVKNFKGEGVDKFLISKWGFWSSMQFFIFNNRCALKCLLLSICSDVMDYQIFLKCFWMFNFKVASWIQNSTFRKTTMYPQDNFTNSLYKNLIFTTCPHIWMASSIILGFAIFWILFQLSIKISEQGG